MKRPKCTGTTFPVLLLDSKYQQNCWEGHYFLSDQVPTCETTKLDSIKCVFLMALLGIPPAFTYKHVSCQVFHCGDNSRNYISGLLDGKSSQGACIKLIHFQEIGREAHRHYILHSSLLGHVGVGCIVGMAEFNEGKIKVPKSVYFLCCLSHTRLQGILSLS